MKASDTLNVLAHRHAQLLEAIDENNVHCKCMGGRGCLTVLETTKLAVIRHGLKSLTAT